MAWLGEELSEEEQAGRTPFVPRCTKDLIEEYLFARRRDLFSTLELVFFDTTSIYFEGRGGETIGRRGHSKDHRPDCPQMVVGAVLDGEGRPVCCEIWPGNTADVRTLLPIVARLHRRFAIGQVCIVADRGMISQETMERLEKASGLRYILGVRMRNQKEVREEVLARAGRYQIVHPKGQHSKAPSPLALKEVQLQGSRYVVCFNEDQAKKDAADRDAIVAGLREQLKGGDKSLVGNQGYRTYLKTQGRRFVVDEEKIQAEARFDGKWVLRTNTELPTAEVALKYKQLWMVEQLFRTTKSLLATRPIFHKRDETIRGHVFCSFLALILRKELQERLQRKGHALEWADVVSDLDALQEFDVQYQHKHFLLRSEVKGTCGKVMQAMGVAVPATVRQLAQEL
jgi:transposase